MSTTGLHPVSPPCAEAREAIALELAGGPAPSAPVRAHVAACRDCTEAVARIEKIWAVPAAAFPKAALAPDSLEHLLAGALARAKEDRPAAPVVPLRPPSTRPARESRGGSGLAAAIGMALAASLAAVAFLAPGVERAGDRSLTQASPTPAPAPVGPPGVRLASAKGAVSFVPADGSVIGEPKPGDALPPGLFAASGGAALAIEGAGTLAVRGDATVLIGGTERAPTVTIARGEIYVDLPKGTIRSFSVHTPTGQVRVTGTRFGVTVGPKSTNVEVTEGTVVVSGPEGETAVEAGQAVNLKAGAVPALVPPSDPAGDPRGWVREIAPSIAPPAPIAALSFYKRTQRANGEMHDEEVQALPGLDKLAVENAMNRRAAALHRCYELALAREPGLEIRAEITFRVDEDGKAESVRIGGLPDRHMKMGLCLMEATKAAVFPGAAAGTQVQVRYPVQFVPPRD